MMYMIQRTFSLFTSAKIYCKQSTAIMDNKYKYQHLYIIIYRYNLIFYLDYPISISKTIQRKTNFELNILSEYRCQKEVKIRSFLRSFVFSWKIKHVDDESSSECFQSYQGYTWMAKLSLATDVRQTSKQKHE